ncbi:MAG: hypothetical protein IPK68_02530 [Bdellovibrionales bacterium]|nr:hypothetical protein [Bdellovibrionales bacterium]
MRRSERKIYTKKISWELIPFLFFCSISLIAFANPNTYLREVNFGWEQVDEATQYEIKISRSSALPSKSEQSKIFVIKNPEWTGSLHPRRYTMALRSFDDRNVPGDWSDPTEFFVKFPAPPMLSPADASKIATNEEREQLTKLEWQMIAGAPEYTVTIESLDGSFKKIETTKTNSLTLSLPVANAFKWTVEVSVEGGDKQDLPNRPSTFSLIGKRLDPPLISKPLSKYVTELTWTKPAFSEEYDLILFIKSNGGWKEIQKIKSYKSQVFPFDLSRQSGTYKLKTQAKAPLRPSSSIAELTFEVRGNIKDPSALAEARLKDSLIKPTNRYFIASYLITQIAYTGANPELNSGAAFRSIGGTGRLGIGYNSRETAWGVFGILDLSGFDLDESRYTFAAAEVHGTWQHYLGNNQIRYATGAYFKELPDLRGNQTSGFSGLGKTRSYGPHAGAQLWRPLSDRLGIQIQGRLYISMLGSGANDQNIVTSLSYQTGILGTYKLDQQTMGYAGYVYRADKAFYESRVFGPSFPDSFASSGDLNTISIEGHYLNLMLEYSF